MIIQNRVLLPTRSKTVEFGPAYSNIHTTYAREVIMNRSMETQFDSMVATHLTDTRHWCPRCSFEFSFHIYRIIYELAFCRRPA